MKKIFIAFIFLISIFFINIKTTYADSFSEYSESFILDIVDYKTNHIICETEIIDFTYNEFINYFKGFDYSMDDNEGIEHYYHVYVHSIYISTNNDAEPLSSGELYDIIYTYGSSLDCVYLDCTILEYSVDLIYQDFYPNGDDYVVSYLFDSSFYSDLKNNLEFYKGDMDIENNQSIYIHDFYYDDNYVFHINLNDIDSFIHLTIYVKYDFIYRYHMFLCDSILVSEGYVFCKEDFIFPLYPSFLGDDIYIIEYMYNNEFFVPGDNISFTSNHECIYLIGKDASDYLGGVTINYNFEEYQFDVSEFDNSKDTMDYFIEYFSPIFNDFSCVEFYLNEDFSEKILLEDFYNEFFDKPDNHVFVKVVEKDISIPDLTNSDNVFSSLFDNKILSIILIIFSVLFVLALLKVILL